MIDSEFHPGLTCAAPMTDDRKRTTGGEVERFEPTFEERIGSYTEWTGMQRQAEGAWVRYSDHDRALAESRAELEEARGMVIEANNSLYGSQGYFHSLDGGAYDRHHLARGIEDVKARLNVEWRRAERLAEALRLLMIEVEASGNADALDFGWPAAVKAARTALNLEPTP